MKIKRFKKSRLMAALNALKKLFYFRKEKEILMEKELLENIQMLEQKRYLTKKELSDYIRYTIKYTKIFLKTCYELFILVKQLHDLEKELVYIFAILFICADESGKPFMELSDLKCVNF